jgi:hypothetical protein
MSSRAYLARTLEGALPRHPTIGSLRRSGRSIEVGCRVCNHLSEIRLSKVPLPAALPVSSAPHYVNCATCGAANSDTDQPIYLSRFE